jgi:hypothetical protein
VVKKDFIDTSRVNIVSFTELTPGGQGGKKPLDGGKNNEIEH